MSGNSRSESTEDYLSRAEEAADSSNSRAPVGSNREDCPFTGRCVVQLERVDGEPLSEPAVVRLDGPTPDVRETTPDTERADFDGLAPGDYEVTVELRGEESEFECAQPYPEYFEINHPGQEETIFFEAAEIRESKTIKYLVWDGVYRDDGTLNQGYEQDEVPDLPRGPAVRPDVRILEVEPVFAPLVENTIIKLEFTNIEDLKGIKLEIFDFDNELAYSEKLSREQLLNLPGEEDRAAAEEANLPRPEPPDEEIGDVATPAGSPYNIVVWLDDLGAAGRTPPELLSTLRDRDVTVTNTRTGVEMAALNLDLMPWGDLYKLLSKKPDTDYPGDSDAESARWVQFKLNELGWFAGPLDGNSDSPDLKKAIVRYRQADRDLFVPPWKRSEDGVFLLDSSVTISDSIDASLLEKLRAEENRRELFSDPEVFNGGADRAQLWIDCERYSNDVIEEFKNEPAGDTTTIKSRKEADWLSEPRVPLLAKVEVKRTNGEAVYVDEVARKIPVRWSWLDSEPDFSNLPASTAAAPGNAAKYVPEAFEHAAREVGSRRKNSREVFGGQITDDEVKNNSVVFEGVDSFDITRGTEPDGWGAETAGGVVYFKPSVVGGDTFTVEAECGEIQVQTGVLEVWRRISVAAQICWSDGSPTNCWDDVRKRYAAAFVELVKPREVKTMADVADETLEGEFAANLERKNLGPASERTLDPEAFDPRSLTDIKVTDTDGAAINGAIRSILGQKLETWESSGVDSESINEEYAAVTKRLLGWGRGEDEELSSLKGDEMLKEAQLFFDSEIKRITKQVNPSDEDVPEDIRSNFIKKGAWMRKNKKRVFLNTADPARLQPYAPGPGLTEKLRKKIDQAIYDLVHDTQETVFQNLNRLVGPGIIVLEHTPNKPVSIGDADHVTTAPPNMMMGAGNVIINRTNFGTYRPDHLFTHEVAHAVFLKHWKNADGYVESDHDRSDENCVMSYVSEPGKTGNLVPGIGDHYAAGRFNPDFCGKCNLKLRGWNIRAKGTTAQTQDLDILPLGTGILEPVPRYEPVDLPPRIPHPALLQQAGDSFLKDLFEEDDVRKYWSKPGPIADPGRIGVFAHPRLVDQKVRWIYYEAKTIPGDVPVAPAPPGHFDYTLDNWHQSLTDWSALGARSVADGVHVNIQCPDSAFSDLVHEACHFFQAWSAAQQFNECLTDLFACIVSDRFRALCAGEPGFSGSVADTPYAFNPSYAESILVGIDQWLPLMGFRELGNLFVKGEAAVWEDIYKNASERGRHSDRLITDCRDDLHLCDVYKRDDLSRAPIISSGSTFRDDIERAVAGAGSLQAELRKAILEFLEFLERQADQLSAKQRRIVSSKSGLERTFAQAKFARRRKKQLAYARLVVEVEHLIERRDGEDLQFLGTGNTLEEYRDYLEKILEPINSETGETIKELTGMIA